MRDVLRDTGHVKINLDFYKGSDLYSDGDIEDELLEIVANNTDFTEILSKDNRWPILYHLTPNRRNLLEWYEFHPDASLLEIGAGCGALTGLFCEHVNDVVAVELSKKRAEINAVRNKEKKNLEIIVGNLNDVKFNRKFDYITLIGVLEYAGKFTDAPNPFEAFLIKIKQLLKPGGTLIIAIENKYGLKYWAGAREDHSGRLFDSLENYPMDASVRTFSKDELTSLLINSGYSNPYFYYPMPDYKIPRNIFSDDWLPKSGDIDEMTPNYDQDRIILFQEKLVYENLIRDNKFDFFANSFLIFCQSEDKNESDL